MISHSGKEYKNVCIYIYRGLPDSSVGKETVCNAGDPGSIPGLGRYPGKGKDYPLQYSGLENSMDCIVHGITKSCTRLSNFHFHSDISTTEKKKDNKTISIILGYSTTGHHVCTVNQKC